MSGYVAATEIYYCKQGESPSPSDRIAPAPTITISPEIYYANDSVIGYTYNITLNGYANALRKEVNANSVKSGAQEVVDHIGVIRDIFNFNGGNLYIKQNNSDIIVAKGATIKNINFNTSSNRWFNYSPYSIELEFNEIDFTGCSNNSPIECNSSFFHSPHQNSDDYTSDSLIDMKKYKIKEFSDKWSITVDNDIYQQHQFMFNNSFKVSYTISATGKNYYVGDKLVPAWQQAKLFVQDRLYNQVKSLLSGMLQIEADNDDACAASLTLSELHDISVGGNGGLIDSSGDSYDVYNETISCDTSEADGTFSVTYNAICKKYDNSLSDQENAALHTYTKNNTVTEGQQINSVITVQGTIQGLVRGGFIYYANNEFQLPQTGNFISTINSNETKYSNALAYFLAKVGDSSDLLSDFKDSIDITKAELLIDDLSYPVPTTFSLDHNYHDGSITYNANYDKLLNERANTGYSNISVVRNDPIEIIQEFIIPGRQAGPLIQKLNMFTAPTISITIEGSDPANRECTDLIDLCDYLPVIDIEDFESLTSENEGWIKTKEEYTTNKIDGSYVISLEYLCRGEE